MRKGVFDIKRKLTTKLTLLILTLLLLLLSVMSGLYLIILENSLKTQIQARALDMAKTLAHMPSVQKAFETDDPSRTLQPIAENARKQSGAQYIVIGSADAIRYAHPDPGKIGKPMVGGDNRRALEKVKHTFRKPSARLARPSGAKRRSIMKTAKSSASSQSVF